MPRSHSSPPLPTEPVARKRVLWIGDAVAATGFERSTRYVCNYLHGTGMYDVHVLGVNYHGDPHAFPYPIYPASLGGDQMGWGRIEAMIHAVKPVVVIIQTDPWQVQNYLVDRLGRSKIGNVPVIGYIAVDGKHCRGTELNGLSHTVFWTKFAEAEARAGGYVGTSSVIPLGVDLDIYSPQDRTVVRERFLTRALTARGLSSDAFVVGVVGRNQWRKRLDLTIEYFAEWIHSREIKDACLWVHSGPSLGDSWDLEDLIHYYGLTDRAMLPTFPKTTTAFAEEAMARLYNMFDVLFTTTLGEGMWLPGFEAAACGLPIIAPRWSAIEEFFGNGAGRLVTCSSTAVHPNQTNTIGGVMDRVKALEALDELYENRELRQLYSECGLALAHEPRFRWETTGREFVQVIERVIGTYEDASTLMGATVAL